MNILKVGLRKPEPPWEFRRLYACEIGATNTSESSSPEVGERAVRMVFDHSRERPSQWAAIQSIEENIRYSGEAFRNWVRQAERDQGKGWTLHG